MSWQPLRDFLRDFLRADAERFVDGIMTDQATDARARAYLAVYRERVVDQLTDKAEAAMLGQFLAQSEQQAAEPHVLAPPPSTNGCAKVH